MPRTRADQLKEAWSKETYEEFMQCCVKYDLREDELRVYNDDVREDNHAKD